MDINFHYFAVRTFAEKAGFSADAAQLLASYSQFVDDYDIEMPFRVSNVPDYASHLCRQTIIGTFFFPVTTALNSWFDMAKLTLEKNQKNVLTPFHFIPVMPLNVSVPSRDKRRVIPQRAGENSVLWQLSEQAKDAYKAAGTERERNIAVICIGTLCHTFADTYAHQNFSGLWGWENHCRLTKVTDNISGKDITADYSPEVYFLLPSIGHCNAYRAPDDSNVSYETVMRNSEKDDYHWNYKRSNTSEYLKCSLNIFNYFRSCLGQPQVAETDPLWQDLREGLRRGFLTSQKNAGLLAQHWHGIFPEISYYYSKDSLLRNILALSPSESNDLGLDENTILSSVLDPQARDILPVLLEVRSDDFYRYNVFAKKVRDAVNGITTELYAPPEFEARLQYLQQQASSGAGL